MNLRVVSAITRKDVVDAIRHRYLLTALVTPLFVALLFRVLLPGATGDKLLTVVVHDTGGSGLVTELRKTPQISVVQANSADATAGEVEKKIKSPLFLFLHDQQRHHESSGHSKGEDQEQRQQHLIQTTSKTCRLVRIFIKINPNQARRLRLFGK